MRTPHLQAIYYPAEASMRTTTSVVSSSGKGIKIILFIIYYFNVACVQRLVHAVLEYFPSERQRKADIRNFILEGLCDRNCFDAV